jgi:hypothetical protein
MNFDAIPSLHLENVSRMVTHYLVNDYVRFHSLSSGMVVTNKSNKYPSFNGRVSHLNTKSTGISKSDGVFCDQVGEVRM